jgi:hypothetical protein
MAAVYSVKVISPNLKVLLKEIPVMMPGSVT